MRLYLSLFTASLLFFSSCQKERLPRKTTEGKNTFGCLIDGKSFVPQDVIGFPTTQGLSVYYNPDSGYLEILCYEKKKQGIRRSITFKIHGLKTGQNNLNSQNFVQLVISTDFELLSRWYNTTDSIGGYLSINRLDTSAKIISGTFSLKVVSAPTSATYEIINITNGRFDVKYPL